jgi:hypothetical protein
MSDKPRIYIEHRPGLDWIGRSQNLWRGVNIYRRAYKNQDDFYLGGIACNTIRDAFCSYRKHLSRAHRKLLKMETDYQI